MKVERLTVRKITSLHHTGRHLIMLFALENEIVFLKPQKCASTSVELFFRQFLSAQTYGPRCDDEAEKIAEEIGAVSPINYRIPLHALDAKSARKYWRSLFRSRPMFRQHHPASSIERVLRTNEFYRFRRISIMRNPYDRVASMFFWRYAKSASPHNSSPEDLVKSFERYVLKSIDELRVLFDSVYKISGSPIVTDWIKFEELSSDTTALAVELFSVDAVEARAPLSQIRTKDGVRPRKILLGDLYAKNWLAELVYENFFWDFNTFGYSYEVPA